MLGTLLPPSIVVVGPDDGRSLDDAVAALVANRRR